jgi:hypothetical protein
VNIFMQEVLNNCGKSAIANARGQLAELSAWNKGDQVEPILQCKGTAKIL